MSGDASHRHEHARGHASHAHAPRDFGRAFGIGIALNVAYVVVETVYGMRVGSMALLADAGHNMGDVLGLVVAWGGAVLARRAPTPRRTYGLRSSTILAALANAVLLLLAVGGIAWEAIGRFGTQQPVPGATVAWVAAIGIIVNLGTALLFVSGRRHDLNVRGAWLHMAADAAVSAGVVAAGLLIAATGWLWLDPAISVVIVLVIAVGTWGLLRDAVNLALDAVPPGIDDDAVRRYLAALPGVTAVQDLHIWGMSTTDVALTVRLVRPGHTDDDALLRDVDHTLREHHGIAHVTVQVERGSGPRGRC